MADTHDTAAHCTQLLSGHSIDANVTCSRTASGALVLSINSLKPHKTISFIFDTNPTTEQLEKIMAGVPAQLRDGGKE